MPELYNVLNQTTNEYEFYIIYRTNRPKTREEILNTPVIGSIEKLEEKLKEMLEESEKAYKNHGTGILEEHCMTSMELKDQGIHDLSEGIKVFENPYKNHRVGRLYDDSMTSMSIKDQGFHTLPKDIENQIRIICDNLGTKICTLPKGCCGEIFEGKEYKNGDIMNRMRFNVSSHDESWTPLDSLNNLIKSVGIQPTSNTSYNAEQSSYQQPYYPQQYYPQQYYPQQYYPQQYYQQQYYPQQYYP